MKHYIYSNITVLLNCITTVFFFNAILFLLFRNKVGTKVGRKNAVSSHFKKNPPHALSMEII